MYFTQNPTDLLPKEIPRPVADFIIKNSVNIGIQYKRGKDFLQLQYRVAKPPNISGSSNFRSVTILLYRDKIVIEEAPRNLFENQNPDSPEETNLAWEVLNSQWTDVPNFSLLPHRNGGARRFYSLKPEDLGKITELVRDSGWSHHEYGNPVFDHSLVSAEHRTNEK